MNERTTASEVRYCLSKLDESTRKFKAWFFKTQVEPLQRKLFRRMLRFKGNAHDRRKAYRKFIRQWKIKE